MTAPSRPNRKQRRAAERQAKQNAKDYWYLSCCPGPHRLDSTCLVPKLPRP